MAILERVMIKYWKTSVATTLKIPPFKVYSVVKLIIKKA